MLNYYSKWRVNECLYNEDHKTPLYFVGIFGFQCICPFLEIYSGPICKANTTYETIECSKALRCVGQHHNLDSPSEFQSGIWFELRME